MKTLGLKHLFILIFACLSVCVGCDNEDDIKICDKLIGEWVEEDPLLYDGISDTIVFTENNIVEKHIFFSGWKYEVENCDNIIFTNLEDKYEKKIEFISDDRLVIYNFIDRLLTNEVKDITFIKLN